MTDDVTCPRCRTRYACAPGGADPGCPTCPPAAVPVLDGQFALFAPPPVPARTGTVAVNLRREQYDVYGGRAGSGKPPRLCTPGVEEGWLGNPHPVAKCGPLALPFFRRYFRDRIARDPVFREAVLALRGKRLGCFCKPQACHLDVVIEFLETGEVRTDVREAQAPETL